jgi:hypothetical protein
LGFFGLPTAILPTSSLDAIATGNGTGVLNTSSTNGGGGPGGVSVSGGGGIPGGGSSSNTGLGGRGLVIVEY